jgi:hypothetical protein
MNTNRLVRSLELSSPLVREFQTLCNVWSQRKVGNEKQVRDAVLDHGDDLPWLLAFGAYFLARLGVAEYATLFRLVDAWAAERKRAAQPDCKTRFRFTCPGTRAFIHADYDHMTGKLDLTVYEDDLADSDEAETAVAFIAEHEGNYFYIRDVRNALVKAGVPDHQIP